MFKNYPVQRSHFHQKKIIQRYITKHPKLQASIDLQTILFRLTKTTESRLKNKLQNWHLKYEEFLNEMTINYDTGEAKYTHYKLREAYASLYSNLDYLFTYKTHKDLYIANTTNHLDGAKFADLKTGLEYTEDCLKNLS